LTAIDSQLMQTSGNAIVLAHPPTY
jgi:hypothetical protein